MHEDQDYRTFPPAERPDIEVLVDGTWHPGELRAWHLRAGAWWANVNYRLGAAQQYVNVVPADHVRQADPPA